MPFHPPRPDASIVPFIIEVRRYLLESTARRRRYNWFRRDYLDHVHAFADDILPNTTTMTALLQGLRVAGRLDEGDAGSYIQLIQGELWRYLSQVGVIGNNALVTATRERPDAVTRLLDAVNGLANPEHKAAILRQVSDNGYNALMIAARHNPTLVATLLDAVNGLANPDLMAAMLSQVNVEGFNAMMLAEYYHPEAIAPILKAINRLANHEHKAAILRQVSSNGDNAMMLAERYHPEAMAPILKAINRLANHEHKAAILEQVRDNGYNILMLAAHFRPEAVAPLLKAVNDLPNPDLMAAILSQVDYDGNNALILAVMHNPQCVDSILSSISTLNSVQKVEILLTTNKEGKTVQDLVSGYHDGALHPSLASIKTAIDSMYSQPPQEDGVPVASSSSAASPFIASPFSFFPPGTAHSPAPDSSALDSSALELAHIEKLSGVKGWRVAGDKLTVEVPRHEKDTVILSLTDSPELDLSVRTTGGRSIISVNRSSQSPQPTPDAPMPGPERKSGQPEDEIPDEPLNEGYNRPGSPG